MAASLVLLWTLNNVYIDCPSDCCNFWPGPKSCYHFVLCPYFKSVCLVIHSSFAVSCRSTLCKFSNSTPNVITSCKNISCLNFSEKYRLSSFSWQYSCELSYYNVTCKNPPFFQKNSHTKDWVKTKTQWELWIGLDVIKISSHPCFVVVLLLSSQKRSCVGNNKFLLRYRFTSVVTFHWSVFKKIVK